MNITDSCLLLIKSFEGFSSKPYHGSADPPMVFSIGYGITHYENGVSVELTDQPITEARAQELLIFWITQKANAIDRFIRKDLSDNQNAALISFAYNLGEGALRSSTLLKKVNANPIDVSIRDEFMKWVHSNGEVVEGLVNRRRDEANLYFTT
jgi:lysozyme